MKQNGKNISRTLRIYWQRTRQNWPVFGVIGMAVMAASGTGVIIPLFFKNFFDVLSANAIPNATVHALFVILAQIAGLELLRWVLWRVAIWLDIRVISRLLAELSEYCFSYLHRHSFTYFNSNFVGSLVKRVNWFTRAFESITDKIIFNFLPLLTDIIIIFVVLFIKNVWLGVGTLIWISIFLTINWLLTSYKLKYDLARSEAESKSTAVLADTITNNANVKLFNGYHREIKRFGLAVDVVRKLRLFTWKLDNLFDGVQGLMTIGLEVGIFVVALRLWQQQLLTVGDFVLLQSYVIILFEKVWDFGKVIRHTYTDLADAAEMTVILETPHEIQDVPLARPLRITSGAIEFSRVVFYYHQTRKIISDFSLRIAPGEKIALVGPSGAGKSTIVKLLLRMHDVSGGHIMIDRQDIARVTQESLWNAVSLVPQEPILFHRTLLENIRYGKPTASHKEIIAAARRAHCHEFITSFPEGYDTYVGERGVKLSGGERQRVAIARAILRNAPILILDEATSSLDSESEHLIQDALRSLMSNKTVIVIAHRLSTIMAMDRTLVIDGGRITEEGTHQKLLDQAGLYSKLWKRQAGGFFTE